MQVKTSLTAELQVEDLPFQRYYRMLLRLKHAVQVGLPIEQLEQEASLPIASSPTAPTKDEGLQIQVGINSTSSDEYSSHD